jgi:predicted DNA-binding transcriptional regulator YafY
MICYSQTNDIVALCELRQANRHSRRDRVEGCEMDGAISGVKATG